MPKHSMGVRRPPAREVIPSVRPEPAPRGQNPPIVVRMPRDEWAYVKKLGERDHRPGSYYVQLALRELVRKHRQNPTQVL